MSDCLSFNQDPEGLILRYMENPKPDLKDLIIVQYSSLVERTARKFAGIEPIDDLTQVGYIGLLNALSKYDPQAGVRFNTYASYLIAGEIKHYLRDRTMTIRHPAWLQELRQKVVKASGLLQQELGRPATEREIAENLQVSETAIREVFQTQEMLKVSSLDAPSNTDEAGENEFTDAGMMCPEQLSLEDRLVLEAAMKKLRELERQVLTLFHFDAMSQTEIASRLDISCNYVSHILRQSLAKLRKILTTEEDKCRLLHRQSSDSESELIDLETGAYTESFFHSRLQEELHRANSSETSVSIFLVKFQGLSNLKKYYGDQSVKDFMSDASDFLRNNVRRLEIVARYGDTGFAIIFPETGSRIGQVRKRLLNKLFAWMHGRCVAGSGVTLEMGQAVAPEDGKTYKEIMAAAKFVPADQLVQVPFAEAA